MSDTLTAGPDTLRVDVHPAGQPWFPGPTAELSGDAWARRARRVVTKRVTGLRGRNAVAGGDEESYADAVVDRLAHVAPGEPRHRLLRWLDVAQTPVVLEATAWARTDEATLRARLLDGSRPLDELRTERDGARILRVDLPPTSTEGDPGEPSVELRYLVDRGDDGGVVAASVVLPADRVGHLVPEVETILLSARVRRTDDPVEPGVRRARRLRRIGSAHLTGPLFAIAAVAAFVVPFGLALSGPLEADWATTLESRPIDQARVITGGLLAAALASHLLSLVRDRHLVQEQGDRDFVHYAVPGVVGALVATSIGAAVPLVAAALLTYAVVAVRLAGWRTARPDVLLRTMLYGVFAAGAIHRWGVHGLPSARAQWTLGHDAPDAALARWAGDHGSTALEVGSLVLVNLAALALVAVLVRVRRAADLGRALPAVFLLLLPLLVYFGAWLTLLALPLLVVDLARRPRPGRGLADAPKG